MQLVIHPNKLLKSNREQCLTEIKQHLYTKARPRRTSIKSCGWRLRLGVCVCACMRAYCKVRLSGPRGSVQYIKCSGALSLLNCVTRLEEVT